MLRLRHGVQCSTKDPTNWKTPTVEEGLEELPRGLRNHSLACFANASLQSLLGVPGLAQPCQDFADDTLEEVEEMIIRDPDLTRKATLTKGLQKKRNQLRSVFTRPTTNL